MTSTSTVTTTTTTTAPEKKKEASCMREGVGLAMCARKQQGGRSFSAAAS